MNKSSFIRFPRVLPVTEAAYAGTLYSYLFQRRNRVVAVFIRPYVQGRIFFIKKNLMGGNLTMKTYKKLMDGIAMLEKLALAASTVLILVLTVGNVFSRKVIHQSWSFTEELVVAVFVLITLISAALACREGELVNLSILFDRLPKKIRKPLFFINTVLCVIFTSVLFKYGMDKVLTQLANGKRTFVLNWPEWIFWSFVPIGAACMILHFIEFFIDYCVKEKEETK